MAISERETDDRSTARLYWPAQIALATLCLNTTIWLIGFFRALVLGWEGQIIGITVRELGLQLTTLEFGLYLVMSAALYLTQILFSLGCRAAALALALTLSCHFVHWVLLASNPVYDGRFGLLLIGLEVFTLGLLLLLIRSRVLR